MSNPLSIWEKIESSLFLVTETTLERKMTEIVNIGETIEDGLKTGKIVCVAALPRSSGLLNRREKTFWLSLLRGERPLEDHHSTKVTLDLHKTFIKLVIRKLVIQMLPPRTKFPTSKLQKSTSCLQKSSSTLQNSITSLPKC